MPGAGDIRCLGNQELGIQLAKKKEKKHIIQVQKFKRASQIGVT